MAGKKLFVFILAFAVIITGLLAFRYFHGTHTEYCPLSHKLSDTADCIVLHKARGRVLIRHADRYRLDYYIEIIDGGRSYKYEIPEYSVNGSAPIKFKVRMIENETGAVTVNGERLTLIPISSGGR